MRLSFVALIVLDMCGLARSQPIVPDDLKPPATDTLAFKARAAGDQVYSCDGSTWVLSGPDAKLSDEAGKQVGSHFAGPTWEWSDGSRVTGGAVANATPDPKSIPWLLMAPQR